METPRERLIDAVAGTQLLQARHAHEVLDAVLDELTVMVGSLTNHPGNVSRVIAALRGDA